MTNKPLNPQQEMMNSPCFHITGWAFLEAQEHNRAESLKLTAGFPLSEAEFVLQRSVSCQKLFWVSNSSEFRLHGRNNMPLKPVMIRQTKNRAPLLFSTNELRPGKASLMTMRVINRWFGGLVNGKHIHPWVMVKSHHRVSKLWRSSTGN